MKYQFDNFQFDLKQQTLSKNGRLLTFNEKPARLLTLFLNQPKKIHNKTDILESVWPNRAISEQVVFQNISYLRSLFGQDAIKTFIKKGYQWQLPLSHISEGSLAPNTKASNEILESKTLDLTNSQASSGLKATKKQLSPNKVMLGLSFGLAFILLFWLSPKPLIENKQAAIITLISADTAASLNHRLTDKLFDSSLFQLKTLSTNLNSQNLFDSPFRTWQSLKLNSSDLIFATRVYSLEKGNVLRFYLQGEYRGWQGHLLINKKNLSQLNQLFKMFTTSNYFSVKSEHAALAELTALHDITKINANFLLIHQLIKTNYELGFLDRAAALTETAIDANPNELQFGLLKSMGSV